MIHTSILRPASHSIAIGAVLLGLLGFAPGCGESTPTASIRPTAGESETGVLSAPVRSSVDVPDLHEIDGDWFEDATENSGVDFTYQNGQEGGNCFILESLGGGVAMFDYDGDGDLDLFFSGGGTITESPVEIAGRSGGMFRNEGDWQFVDVTIQAGLHHAGDYSHGCAVDDFDRDGSPDLLVCCYGSCNLYHNLGDGRFQDVTQDVGLSVPGWNTSAAFADIDRDGFPDLYIVQYLQWGPEIAQACHNREGTREVCSPGQFQGSSDRLFRNRGDGTLEDYSARVGLTATGNGLGVVAADFNSDGWIDFYVANDESNNYLYFGCSSIGFEEEGMSAGVATNEYGMHDGSMGVDAGDYDGDGKLDLWVTNFEAEDNALYRNLGDNVFAQSTVVAGLAGHSRRFVSFGTGLADFDLDGWLDIFAVNGHVFYQGGQMPYLQTSQLFRNSGGTRFEDVSPRGGNYFRTPHANRGAAVGDLDNDGALDLVVVSQNTPVALLRNLRRPANYLSVSLIGTTSDRRAVGASAVHDYHGRQVTRHVRSGAGYFSHSDQRILFPVRSKEPIEVQVTWPGGHRETFSGLRPNTTQVLIEGRGEPQTSS